MYIASRAHSPLPQQRFLHGTASPPAGGYRRCGVGLGGLPGASGAPPPRASPRQASDVAAERLFGSLSSLQGSTSYLVGQTDSGICSPGVRRLSPSRSSTAIADCSGTWQPPVSRQQPTSSCSAESPRWKPSSGASLTPSKLSTSTGDAGGPAHRSSPLRSRPSAVGAPLASESPRLRQAALRASDSSPCLGESPRIRVMPPPRHSPRGGGLVAESPRRQTLQAFPHVVASPAAAAAAAAEEGRRGHHDFAGSSSLGGLVGASAASSSGGQLAPLTSARSSGLRCQWPRHELAEKDCAMMTTWRREVEPTLAQSLQSAHAPYVWLDPETSCMGDNDGIGSSVTKSFTFAEFKAGWDHPDLSDFTVWCMQQPGPQLRTAPCFRDGASLTQARTTASTYTPRVRCAHARPVSAADGSLPLGGCSDSQRRSSSLEKGAAATQGARSAESPRPLLSRQNTCENTSKACSPARDNVIRVTSKCRSASFGSLGTASPGTAGTAEARLRGREPKIGGQAVLLRNDARRPPLVPQQRLCFSAR
eukprot:TRINITY_DN7162_c1_g2_i1.p1 TRINITY_DN7162_c1_g2~~TRINITY_DN7162_c1_g2_i1.p1  ORF type:complete len:535 (-),score=72.41 TRINITY_DN7162_c1_g2_i1:15-1619(-)